MSPKLPVVSGRQTVRALEGAGFSVDRQHGSHVTLRGHGRSVTVPLHSGEDLPVGTLASVLRQSGLTADESRRLL